MVVKKRSSGKITFDQMLESNEETNAKNVFGKPFQAVRKKICTKTLSMFIVFKEQ